MGCAKWGGGLARVCCLGSPVACLLPQSFPDDTVARNSAALLALHYLEPTRQYDRMFPEPYKTLWQTLTGTGARMQTSGAGSAAGKPLSARAKKKQKAGGTEAHVCPKCGKVFKKEHGLATHDKREHPPPKKKPGDPETGDEDDSSDSDGGGGMWDNVPKIQPVAAAGAGAGAGAGGGASAAAAAPAPAAATPAAVPAAPPAAVAATAAAASPAPAAPAAAAPPSLPPRAAPAPLPTTLTSQSYFASKFDRRKDALERQKRKAKRHAGKKGMEMANRDPTIMMGDRHRSTVEALLEECGFGASYIASRCAARRALPRAAGAQLRPLLHCRTCAPLC